MALLAAVAIGPVEVEVAIAIAEMLTDLL